MLQSFWQLLGPPRIMLGKTAGHVHEALETTLNALWSSEKLQALGKAIVFIADTGDSASANRKAMLFFGKHAGERVLCVAGRCLVHQLFRGVVTILERVDLVKDFSSVANVVRISARQDTLRRAIARIVDTSLVYEAGIAPPADDAPHRQRSRKLLDALVNERTARTSNLWSTTQSESVQENAKSLHAMLHSPWDSPCIVHYCPAGCSCGRTREKAVGRILELMYWLFFTMMPSGDNFARWTVLGPYAAWMAMCMCLHFVFQRAWRMAFRKEVAGDDALPPAPDIDVGLESFSQQIGRRIKRASDFMEDRSKLAFCLTLAMVSKPIDELVLSLLRLDVAGRVLADLTSRSSQA